MKKIFVKYKTLSCIFIVFVLIASLISRVVSIRVSKFNGITIVLDAGHGGLDVK